MALGLNFSSGASGDIVPFIKFDARAGRMFRRDRTQEGDGSYANSDEDITSSFKAVIDLENIEVGYAKFEPGSAPELILVKFGQPMPPKPTDEKFKQAARLMLKLHASCGGDVREISGNSAAFLRGIDDLHTAYEAGKTANPGKLPIVVLETTVPITTGSGQHKSTNYQPVFKITGWAPRPADLVHVPKVSAESAPSAPLSAPSTGSTQVGAPPASKQAAMVDANDFG